VTAPFNTIPYYGTGDSDTQRTLPDIDSSGELYSWLSTVFTDTTFKEQKLWPDDSPWNEEVEWNDTYTPSTVGSFNRILMVRMSTKMWKTDPAEFGAFDEYSPMSLAGRGHSKLSADNYYAEAEDKNRLCPDFEVVRLANETAPPCLWYTPPGKGSYADSGGFVAWLDPMDGRESFKAKLMALDQVGVFDMHLATFVVDMMVFNTNLEVFLQIAWEFSFDFAGNCHKAKRVRGFNLNLNNSSEERYVFLNVLKFVLAGLVVVFVVIELRIMCEIGLFQHFRKAASFVDFLSLGICTVALASFAYLQGMPIMDKFTFSSLTDLETRQETYVALEDIASAFEDQGYIVGINLLVVFVRALFLVAPLQQNMGIIFKVVDVAGNNLAAFVAMFLVCQTSFVIMAYFTFGAGFEEMSTPQMAFYRCFSMMTGKPIYDELYKADQFMGPLFYFVYYIFFYLIMVNMFVSILLNAYDLVDFELMNKRGTGKDKEKNIIMKITEEFRQDVLGRFWRCFGACSGIFSMCLRMFSGCFRDCMECLPKPPAILPRTFSLLHLKGKRSENDGEHSSQSKKKDKSKDKDTDKGRFAFLGGIDNECVLMIFLMLVFTVFASFITNGEEVYLVSQATLHSKTLGVVWKPEGLSRMEDFTDIRTFEQVEEWSRSFLKEMYANTQCLVYVNGSGIYHSMNIEGAIATSCDNKNNWNQLVQRVETQNTGFLNTTFVRLTIQPACFVSSTGRRWSDGSPYVRATPKLEECASTRCTDVLSQQSCRTADGMSLAMSEISNITVKSTMDSTNISDRVTYNFSAAGTDLGSYNMNGGFVFSFGNRPEDCLEKLRYLSEDGWFSQNSASMVFDWITYNGNIDMFTKNMVSFSLLGTGEMRKTSFAQTIPLNISQGGGFLEAYRITSMVLFWVYFLLVAYFMVRYVLDMKNARNDEQFMDRSVGFFLKAWFGDPWHWTDLISLTISTYCIVCVFLFVMHKFRNEYEFRVDSNAKYEVPNSDVKKYGMAKAVDPQRPLQDDWYIFMQFESLVQMFRTILLMTALNSFFISIKVVKYFGKIGRIKPFSVTLGQGMARNTAFAFAMLMGMVGFSFFFHIIFGHVALGFETFSQTLLTIFNWIVGDYDLTELFEVHFSMAFISFLLYMVAFYFIAVNMFLATMLNTYSTQVGKLDIKSAKLQSEKNRKSKMVEYPDKAMLSKDLKFEFDTEINEFVIMVDGVAPEGAASRAGIIAGSVLSKVNREKDKWKRETVEDMVNDGIQKDDRRGTITLIFRDRAGLHDHFGGNLFHKETGDNIKPTVKNFWVTQGAIASVERRLGEEDFAGLGKGAADAGEKADSEPSDDEAAAEGDDQGLQVGMFTKLGRARTKKRLERLLFSRWELCGQDGARVEPGKFWIDPDTHGNTVEECDMFEDDIVDIEDLRETIEAKPVSGHEAWLDCLMTALEQETLEEESIFTDLLRTNDMQELASRGVAKMSQGAMKPVQEFYKHAGAILRILENKAQKKYFECLRHESDDSQRKLRKQNVILHEYVCALEEKFTTINNQIHGQKAVKERMLTLLAGAMEGRATGSSQYSALDRPPLPPPAEEILGRARQAEGGSNLRARGGAVARDSGAGVGALD